MGLKKTLLSIFLDYTTDGGRVKTDKEFSVDENGRRHISKISKVIPDTGEVLEESLYSANSKRPYAVHVRRPYILN